METEQMMACLLDEIKTNQVKLDAKPKEMKEEMRADQKLLKEEMLVKMESNQERIDAKLYARIDSQLETMVDVFE
jgi:hypothetical protein